MFNSRKGVSEVVANVLIVLLVIVGIAVIWSVVKPTIDKGASGIQSDCFTVQVQPITCTIAGAGGVGAKATVNIKRNPGSGQFEALDVVLEDSGGNTRKVSPDTAITSSTLTELSTTGAVATFDGSTFSPVKANIVITSNGQLCQITSQPVNCA